MATFGTFVSGQVLTAAELNSGGTWQSYTPTWTQSATITKTVNWARYCEFNKLIVVNIKMTASSNGTSSNKILVGLPVNASANNFLVGSAIHIDASTTPDGFRTYFAVYESATTVAFMSTQPGSGFDATKRIAESNSFGIDIETNDVFYVQLTYEAA